MTHQTQRHDCKHEISDIIIKINEYRSKVVKRNSLPGCYAVEKQLCLSSERRSDNVTTMSATVICQVAVAT